MAQNIYKNTKISKNGTKIQNMHRKQSKPTLKFANSKTSVESTDIVSNRNYFGVLN